MFWSGNPNELQVGGEINIFSLGEQEDETLTAGFTRIVSTVQNLTVYIVCSHVQLFIVGTLARNITLSHITSIYIVNRVSLLVKSLPVRVFRKVTHTYAVTGSSHISLKRKQSRPFCPYNPLAPVKCEYMNIYT